MFGTILKTLRDQKRVSQTQLAKEIGVSAGNISDWETGRSKPGYNALRELSIFFGLSADYLLELTHSPVKTAAYDKLPEGSLGKPLSKIECDVVSMLRLLNDHDRKISVDFITMLYEQTIGEKGSIYLTYTAEEKGLKEDDPAPSTAANGTA